MSTLKNQDYRKFEKTLVGFLDEGETVKNIKKISDSIERIEDLIESKTFLKEHIKQNICLEELNVSNNYYRKFCAIVDSITNKNEMLKYLYNIWLCGQGLSLQRHR